MLIDCLELQSNSKIQPLIGTGIIHVHTFSGQYARHQSKRWTVTYWLNRSISAGMVWKSRSMITTMHWTKLCREYDSQISVIDKTIKMVGGRREKFPSHFMHLTRTILWLQHLVRTIQLTGDRSSKEQQRQIITRSTETIRNQLSINTALKIFDRNGLSNINNNVRNAYRRSTNPISWETSQGDST